MQEMDFEERFMEVDIVNDYSLEAIDELLENDEITVNEAALLTSKDLML